MSLPWPPQAKSSHGQVLVRGPEFNYGCAVSCVFVICVPCYGVLLHAALGLLSCALSLDVLLAGLRGWLLSSLSSGF